MDGIAIITMVSKHLEDQRGDGKAQRHGVLCPSRKSRHVSNLYCRHRQGQRGSCASALAEGGRR